MLPVTRQNMTTEFSGEKTVIKNIRFALIMIAGLVLAACENGNPTLEKIDNTFLKRDPQVLVDSGATQLTREQARERISGNTEFWSEGTVYYHPDGQLETNWRKIKSAGSWSVKSNGDVCLITPTWKKCHYYLELDGTVTTVVGGKTTGVLPVKPGKQAPQ